GTTFQASSTCPTRPYARRGACTPPPAGSASGGGGRRCTSNSDCGNGEQCAGAQGCGATWTCVPAKPCTKDLVTFCGCDGKSFFGSSTCPGKPFAHRSA